MKLAGLILAGGASRRMGSPKALLKLAGETFLDRLILLLAPHCDPVVVVLGYDAEPIRSGIRLADRVRFVVNPAPERGQLSSLQSGLLQIPANAAGVIFSPVDCPNLRPATVARLVEEFEAAGGRAMVALPTCHGRRGHPVCIARQLFADFLELPPEAQAREVIHANRERTRYVEVADTGILGNVNDPDEYRRLVRAAAESETGSVPRTGTPE